MASSVVKWLNLRTCLCMKQFFTQNLLLAHASLCVAIWMYAFKHSLSINCMEYSFVATCCPSLLRKLKIDCNVKEARAQTVAINFEFVRERRALCSYKRLPYSMDPLRGTLCKITYVRFAFTFHYLYFCRWWGDDKIR